MPGHLPALLIDYRFEGVAAYKVLLSLLFSHQIFGFVAFLESLEWVLAEGTARRIVPGLVGFRLEGARLHFDLLLESGHILNFGVWLELEGVQPVLKRLVWGLIKVLGLGVLVRDFVSPLFWRDLGGTLRILLLEFYHLLTFGPVEGLVFSAWVFGSVQISIVLGVGIVAAIMFLVALWAIVLYVAFKWIWELSLVSREVGGHAAAHLARKHRFIIIMLIWAWIVVPSWILPTRFAFWAALNVVLHKIAHRPLAKLGICHRKRILILIILKAFSVLTFRRFFILTTLLVSWV